MKKWWSLFLLLVIPILIPSFVNSLSDIQSVACESASNNNCYKLQDIGLVTKEECCSQLNLCCDNTITREAFKTVLIDAIIDYFTSNSSKLNTNELKDFIIAYFSTSGDTIDLSSRGTNSGKKLIDIYNMTKTVPPTPPPTVPPITNAKKVLLDTKGCWGSDWYPGKQCNSFIYTPNKDGGGLKAYTMAAGETIDFIIPIGNILARDLPGYQEITAIRLNVAAKPEGNGDISAKVIAPTGEVWDLGRTGTADTSLFNIFPLKSPWVVPNPHWECKKIIGSSGRERESCGLTGVASNYNHDYITKGDWIFEITAFKESSMLIWWSPGASFGTVDSIPPYTGG